MAVSGYLPNLKRGLGLAFGAHFQYYFSIKCSLILYQLTKFNVISFFLLKILIKMCYKVLI